MGVIILLVISPTTLVLIDASTFLIAAGILRGISSIISPQESAAGSFFERLFTGYQKICFVAEQRNLLTLRLLLLFALSVYDVVVTMLITHLAKTTIPDSPLPFLSFSSVLGCFSALTAVATTLASLCTQRFSRKHLLTSAYWGLFCLMLGLLLWATPTTWSYCWESFILGTLAIGFGLSFSRFFLYTAGFELTEQHVFVQIVSSADAMARLWQSCIATATIALSACLPLSSLMLASCGLMAFAMLPIKNLIRSIDRVHTPLLHSTQKNTLNLFWNNNITQRNV